MSSWSELINTEKLQQIVVDNITDQWASLISVLPNLIGALLILLSGWLFAFVLRKVTMAALKKIGFDRLSSEAGMLSVMDNAGFKKQPSDIAGKIIYWLVLFMFMVPAADTLGFDDLVQLIKSIVSFLPKLIIAIVILLLGSTFAKFVKETITNSTLFSNINASATIANAIYAVIIASIILMALEQLNINTQLLHSIMMLSIAGIVVALALAVGLGAREIAKNLLAGSYARENFTKGVAISVGEYQGVVKEVSTLSTFIELSDGQLVSIPNSALYEQSIKVSTSV